MKRRPEPARVGELQPPRLVDTWGSGGGSGGDDEEEKEEGREELLLQ